VVSIERNCSGWKLFVRRRGSIEPCVENLTCDKLSMATGIISKPKLPKLDVSKFDGFSFHSVDMNSRYQELLADEVKNVTIVGGHKSALEAVGTCSQAGKNVEWLVTSGGAGPPWMMPARDPKGVSKSKKALKRALVALGPSIYHSDRWINRFLYSGRSWLGTWLQNWFWGFMTKEILGDTYTKSENSRKLKPNFDR
jgi:dimethylaniline monooxygenase (N-oxide forming)